MSDDLQLCRQGYENVMRFKSPKVTSTSVYDDSVSFLFPFDVSSYFHRFKTASLLSPMSIYLPALQPQGDASTSYYIGYYKGVSGSSVDFYPYSSDSINDLSSGSIFTIHSSGNVFLLFLFSYKKVWYIGAADQAVSIHAGLGIRVTGDYPDFTIINDNPNLPVSISAGTGISISGTYPNFTVINTAPDRTVAISGGTGISATGTYPNFTVTNTAPDQTVTLTAGSNITITGSYPNFTIIAAGGGMTSKYLNASSTAGTFAFTSGTLTPFTGAFTFNSSSGAGDWTNTGGGAITYIGTPASFNIQGDVSQTSSTVGFAPRLVYTLNNLTYLSYPNIVSTALGSSSTGAFDTIGTISVNLNTNDVIRFQYSQNAVSSGTSTNFKISFSIFSI